MKIVCTHVLASDTGIMLPWGLCGFDSVEDAAGFLDFLRAELACGAADYLEEVRRQARKPGDEAKGASGGAGSRARQKSFRAELDFALQRLVTVGNWSCEKNHSAQIAIAMARQLQGVRQRERSQPNPARKARVARQLRLPTRGHPEQEMDMGVSR